MPKILPVFLPFASCGNKCIFCDQQAISGVQAESDLLLHAEKQINQWKTYSNNYDEIAFYGGNFCAINKDIRLSLYEKAYNNGIKKIRFSTRPDTINSDTLKEIKDYNIYLVELGIQSLDDEVLKANGRPYTSYEAVKAVENLLKVTKCGVQLMTSMYKQNMYSPIDDAAYFSKMDISTARIYPTQVLKNTYLNKLYEQGEYIPSNLEDILVSAAGMYIHFTAENIKVIRMGLPHEAEDSREITAGAGHKSFGDMVITLIMLLYMDMGGRIKYSGYKKAGRELFSENFNKYEEVNKNNMQEICSILRSEYLENSERFIEGQAAFYADKLKNKANN